MGAEWRDFGGISVPLVQAWAGFRMEYGSVGAVYSRRDRDDDNDVGECPDRGFKGLTNVSICSCFFNMRQERIGYGRVG